MGSTRINDYHSTPGQIDQPTTVSEVPQVDDSSSRPDPLYIQVRLPGTLEDVEHFRRRLSRAISPIAKFRFETHCVQQYGQDPFEVYIPRIAWWSNAFASDFRAITDLVAVLSRIVALAHQHNLVAGYLRVESICRLDEKQHLNTPLLQDVLFDPKAVRAYDDDEILKLPPELITRGLRQLGPANLVYALGTLLFQLVARDPTVDSQMDACTRLHTTKNPPLLTDLVPETPPSLSRVCERALNRKVHWRYQSPDEMAEDLRDFNRGKKLRANSTHATRTANTAVRVAMSIVALVTLTAAVAVTLPSMLDLENDFDSGDELLYDD